MTKGKRGTGVEIREHSLRVHFTWLGRSCKERLDKPPTPPNIKYAERLVQEIRRRINMGTFVYSEFFPNSPRVVPSEVRVATLKEMGDLWLQSKGRLASATKSQYSNALKFWYEMLGEETRIQDIRHMQLTALIGSHPWPSAKMANNALIPLRGVFEAAAKEFRFENPMIGIENAKAQKPAPDPFDMTETERILASLFDKYDEQIGNYFEFAFFSGLRPEEQIALPWSNVDISYGQARIDRARSFRGEEKPIKTYQARDIDLNSRTLAVLKRQRPKTGAKPHGFVFENPVTERPWHDERSQRDHYWKPTLRRLGIRDRRAYNTRHTFATMALMAGANPAYIGKQLGHKSSKMIFEVYAKWIERAAGARDRELGKIEGMIGAQPNRTAGQK